MNTPLDRQLEILDLASEEDGEFKHKAVWSADLEEVADPRDPEAARYADAVPAFHGLSKGGEAQGQLIYANYGTKEDYDLLVSKGANLTGKIVLVRYGGLFRGLKVSSLFLFLVSHYLSYHTRTHTHNGLTPIRPSRSSKPKNSAPPPSSSTLTRATTAPSPPQTGTRPTPRAPRATRRPSSAAASSTSRCTQETPRRLARRPTRTRRAQRAR